MTAEKLFHYFKSYVLHPVRGAEVTFNKVYNYYYAKSALPRRQRNYTPEQKALRADISGDYEYWINKVEAGYETGEVFSYNPLISVIVPVYNIKTDLLMACIDSVREQTYENWELILVDDCSPMAGVWRDCQDAAKTDERIKAYRQEKNGGISSATNAAISHASGEFIALLDCDDVLAKNALYENVKFLNIGGTPLPSPQGEVPEGRRGCPLEPWLNYDLIYSDEDKIDEAGSRRFQPYFKPDFSPDSLLSYMYICHLSLYRRSVVDAVGGLRSEFDGSQDYDLALRVSERVGAARIGHIPKILYHWRSREGSTAGGVSAKSYTIERSIAVKEDALKRRGIAGHAEPVPDCEHSRVVYDPVGEPLVSIIIPSKDHPDVLRTCISSLCEITTYKNYEIIVVDNGSNAENKAGYEVLCSEYGARYSYEPMDFNFSRMCNIGAGHASGSYYLFLNDDTQVIQESAGWLSSMLGMAMQPHAGAVGCKLRYSDGNSIQHVGVVNTRSGPGHMFCTFDDSVPHYFNKNQLDIDVIAVTAACLMIDRKKYEEIDGFDESFAVAYNDMDFCFKLYEAGYYNIVRNDAILIHHESLSRGDDFTDRSKVRRLFSERERLYKKHPTIENRDPFYSVNLNQFAPDHEFNFDEYYDFFCEKVDEAVEFTPSDPAGEDIKFDITNIIVDWAVHIVGWVLFIPDNDYGPFEMLLVSSEDPSKRYRMATKRMYLEEVGNAFYRVDHSEFAGFRTMSDRKLIDEGEYEIYFLRRGVAYRTGKRVVV